MNKEHTPEFIRIMTNYMNEKSNKNKSKHNNILTLLEHRNKDLIKIASDQELLGLEKIYYDALDNRGIANRVKLMKDSGNTSKKIQLKKMIKILEGKPIEEEMESERTVFTRDLIQKKYHLNQKQSNPSFHKHSKFPSNNISILDECNENCMFPRIISKILKMKKITKRRKFAFYCLPR